ncbi:bone morphogenetic protein 7-like [Tropilaelaps mercedesae]|uniref:Bone morphogenetic protein 7-like n=1 Tax=Tropilaelaps mercedesae TaxID=418985 RepID=A0A1V9X3L9_9ACAR|nr:bone morphogenetic protein 7-like [Tropilaelaps mercedesae]
MAETLFIIKSFPSALKGLSMNAILGCQLICNSASHPPSPGTETKPGLELNLERIWCFVAGSRRAFRFLQFLLFSMTEARFWSSPALTYPKRFLRQNGALFLNRRQLRRWRATTALRFYFNVSRADPAEELLQAQFHIYKLRPKNRKFKGLLEVRAYQVMPGQTADQETGNRLLDVRRVAYDGLGWEPSSGIHVMWTTSDLKRTTHIWLVTLEGPLGASFWKRGTAGGTRPPPAALERGLCLQSARQFRSA